MRRYLPPFLLGLGVFLLGFVLLDYLIFGLQGLTLMYEG